MSRSSENIGCEKNIFATKGRIDTPCRLKNCKARSVLDIKNVYLTMDNDKTRKKMLTNIRSLTFWLKRVEFCVSTRKTRADELR